MPLKKKHPMSRGLTRVQWKTFEDMVFEDPDASRHPKTLAALEAAGLILLQRHIKPTVLGNFEWVTWYVPTGVHASYFLEGDFPEPPESEVAPCR